MLKDFPQPHANLRALHNIRRRPGVKVKHHHGGTFDFLRQGDRSAAMTFELIEAGAIGRLTWVICGAASGRYHEEEPERASTSGGTIDPSWYFRKPGGGPMYDMTVYALHSLTGVLGPDPVLWLVTIVLFVFLGNARAAFIVDSSRKRL
jgi:hypothetical protein